MTYPLSILITMVLSKDFCFQLSIEIPVSIRTSSTLSILIILLSANLPCFAQNIPGDRKPIPGAEKIYLAELKASNTGVERIESLLKLSAYYVYSSHFDEKDFEKARSYGYQARKLSSSLNYQDGINEARLLIANTCLESGQDSLGRLMLDSVFVDIGSSSHIRFSLQLDPFELDVSQAVPIGLIVNEAITNSIKYAFQNGNDGNEISISFKKVNGNKVILLITDNGVGIIASKEDTQSLGMKLMRGLTEDIEGIFSIESAQGVSIMIEFLANIPFRKEMKPGYLNLLFQTHEICLIGNHE